ncbi:MAG: vWA domain-containing protein [Caldilinea sp.]
MPYQAEISRSNPSCFLFLIDQSGSMEDPFAGGDSSRRKADLLADAINRLLQNLVIKCAKEEGIRDYFHVGVIGYGAKVGPALGGQLAGRELVPISDIGNLPARIEERKKKVEDGAGGLVEQTIRFPIWFDPVYHGATPMCQALTLAHDILARWLPQHPDSFPPIVINITDGEATDGDPSTAAGALRSLATSDGNVILFNVHLSSKGAKPIEFPASADQLPDQHAQLMFELSSPLTPYMRTVAQQEGYSITEGSRGFVFNADMISVIKFLDIGTRPSNLR